MTFKKHYVYTLSFSFSVPKTSFFLHKALQTMCVLLVLGRAISRLCDEWEASENGDFAFLQAGAQP